MIQQLSTNVLSPIRMILVVLLLLQTAKADQPSESCSSASEASSSEQCEQAGKSKIRLGLEWFVNPDHLPLIVAEKHGIFEQFSLDVELVEPADHWEAEEEILAGRLDVAVTEPLHLAQDAARGKPVLGFSRFLHTDGGVMFDTSRSGIRRPSDMCGKTISYPGSPGPGGPAIVQTMVKADGKDDCDLDSYGKHNGGFYHTDAIESGKADLATLIFWNFEIPEAKARGMSEIGFFSLKEWGVPDFCQLVLMTTPQRFQEQQANFRRLVLAMRRATGLIHQQPDLARRYYKEFIAEKTGNVTTENDDDNSTQNQVLEATMTATLPAFPNDNSMSSDYYDRLMDWLIETEQVEKVAASNVAVDTYWTNAVAW